MPKRKATSYARKRGPTKYYKTSFAKKAQPRNFFKKVRGIIKPTVSTRDFFNMSHKSLSRTPRYIDDKVIIYKTPTALFYRGMLFDPKSDAAAKLRKTISPESWEQAVREGERVYRERFGDTVTIQPGEPSGSRSRKTLDQTTTTSSSWWPDFSSVGARQGRNTEALYSPESIAQTNQAAKVIVGGLVTLGSGFAGRALGTYVRSAPSRYLMKNFPGYYRKLRGLTPFKSLRKKGYTREIQYADDFLRDYAPGLRYRGKEVLAKLARNKVTGGKPLTGKIYPRKYRMKNY